MKRFASLLASIGLLVAVALPVHASGPTFVKACTATTGTGSGPAIYPNVALSVTCSAQAGDFLVGSFNYLDRGATFSGSWIEMQGAIAYSGSNPEQFMEESISGGSARSLPGLVGNQFNDSNCDGSGNCNLTSYNLQHDITKVNFYTICNDHAGQCANNADTCGTNPATPTDCVTATAYVLVFSGDLGTGIDPSFFGSNESNGTSGTSTSPSWSTSSATSNANDILIGSISWSSTVGISGITSGFTNQATISASGQLGSMNETFTSEIGYQIVSATQNFTYAGTLNQSKEWVAGGNATE